MPLYEYKCEKCGKRVEILQRVSDKPYTHCPNCGGDMKKQISSPAIQFKGSGFYKTDYPTKSSTPTGESKTGESKSESKSDPTPASKTTDKKSD